MRSAVEAGAAYFASVFAAGFALGIVRVTVLVPIVGSLGAVLLELPVILTVSWILCGWILRRFDVAPDVSRRLVMGGVAFALLLGAEVVLSTVAFGRTPATYLTSLATAEGALGLAGQMVFALFPWMRLRSDTPHRTEPSDRQFRKPDR